MERSTVVSILVIIQKGREIVFILMKIIIVFITTFVAIFIEGRKIKNRNSLVLLYKVYKILVRLEILRLARTKSRIGSVFFIFMLFSCLM